jgi:hypothetical protein
MSNSQSGPNDPPDPDVNEPEIPANDPDVPPEGLPPDVLPEIPPVERPEI